jgi:putative endonuclease
MHYCYILYSKQSDKFYIGETSDFELRLKQHNEGYYKSSYTIQAKDWAEFLKIECANRTEARKLEMFLKRMKSRTFLEKLNVNPQLLLEILKSKIRGS